MASPPRGKGETWGPPLDDINVGASYNAPVFSEKKKLCGVFFLFLNGPGSWNFSSQLAPKIRKKAPSPAIWAPKQLSKTWRVLACQIEAVECHTNWLNHKPMDFLWHSVWDRNIYVSLVKIPIEPKNTLVQGIHSLCHWHPKFKKSITWDYFYTPENVTFYQGSRAWKDHREIFSMAAWETRGSSRFLLSVEKKEPPGPRSQRSLFQASSAWWFQPTQSEKYESSNWKSSPNFRGENKKYLSCHHLVHPPFTMACQQGASGWCGTVTGWTLGFPITKASKSCWYLVETQLMVCNTWKKSPSQKKEVHFKHQPFFWCNFCGSEIQVAAVGHFKKKKEI